MESSTVALEHEHRIVQKVVAGMAILADELTEGKPVRPQLLKEIIEFLRGFVDQCYHAKEDKYLFPLLEQRGVPAGGCPLAGVYKILAPSAGDRMGCGTSPAAQAFER